jgi:hypothetical protein
MWTKEDLGVYATALRSEALSGIDRTHQIRIARAGMAAEKTIRLIERLFGVSSERKCEAYRGRSADGTDEIGANTTISIEVGLPKPRLVRIHCIDQTRDGGEFAFELRFGVDPKPTVSVSDFTEEEERKIAGAFVRAACDMMLLG